jgi:hypothetical protein
MIKSIILLVIVLYIPLTQVKSQQSNTLFFMHSVPQSNFINPAIQGECRWFIGLPVISSTHLNLAHNGFTVNNLLESQEDTLYALDAERIEKKLARMNYLSSEFYTHLFAIGYKRKDFYFTFSIRERDDFVLFYPRDLFAFTYRGNTQFEGEWISLNGTGIQFNHFREYAIGISKKYDDYRTFGIRGKILFGKLNLNTRKSKIGLFTQENTFNLLFVNDILVNASLPYSLGIDSSGNYYIINEDYTFNWDLVFNRRNLGLAVDAGFIYKYDENITFSGSILDIGAIYYRSNLTNYDVEGDFFYDGPLGDTIPTESYLEDVVNTFTDGSIIDNRSYIYFLQPKIFVGATYKLNDKINLGGLLAGKIYRQKIQSGLILSANARFASYFSASLSWSYIHRSVNNLGLGLAFGRMPLQFYIVSDNVPGMIWLQSSKNINLRFGLNIIFGCYRKESIKGCGCYWIREAEESRERKYKLMNK